MISPEASPQPPQTETEQMFPPPGMVVIDGLKTVIEKNRGLAEAITDQARRLGVNGCQGFVDESTGNLVFDLPPPVVLDFKNLIDAYEVVTAPGKELSEYLALNLKAGAHYELLVEADRKVQGDDALKLSYTGFLAFLETEEFEAY